MSRFSSLRALQIGAAIGRQLDAATQCPTCGKKTLLANTNLTGAYRNATPETPTLATHCACPGGPAEHLRPELVR